jgi:hypothetical protein
MVTGNTEPVRLTQTRFREFPFLFKPAQYEVPLATRCRIALDRATDVTAFLLNLGLAVRSIASWHPVAQTFSRSVFVLLPVEEWGAA